MNDSNSAGKAKFEKLLTACAVDAALFHETSVRLVEEYKTGGLAGMVDTVRHAEEIAGRLTEHTRLLLALVVSPTDEPVDAEPEDRDPEPTPSTLYRDACGEYVMVSLTEPVEPGARG